MSEPAWEALTHELSGRFRRWGAQLELAEDLRQETLLRVQQGLPGLADEERMGPWVARIARNVWIDHLRARRLEQGLPEGEAPVPEALRSDPVEVEDVEGFVASWLPLMVASLDEPHRTALQLVELEGWSQQRLARELGLSPSGARTRVQRARKVLRAALEQCCQIHWEGGDVVDWRRHEPSCDC